ncbi:54S ribosomal protein L33, mitochondrial [Cyphellophora attinorum]|uniref:Large ribosomal subunit protein uL30m n=1 Tax=Cyphellophora attinorum TaxID=1664694 RepID=A0A0N0NNY7_9EURO|nr:54S ribosomal protein L33, mitochondrial [Phialophora attinorum]KPI42131.1 54S ribosomal protein L33, mitochondrial [Phialophora attinorum]
MNADWRRSAAKFYGGAQTPLSPKDECSQKVIIATAFFGVFSISKCSTSAMAYFRITLIRSAIGLPAKSSNVLKALGLRKRMATVFHPVSPDVAGQLMKVKELIAVKEVDQPMTKAEVHMERKPDPGFYVESRAADRLKAANET